jgi:hypothetical protein
MILYKPDFFITRKSCSHLFLTLSLFFTFLCNKTFSQQYAAQNDKRIDLKAGVFFNRTISVDNIFSQVSYAGSSPAFLLGITKEKTRTMQSITTQFNTGKLAMNNGPEYTAQHLFFNLDYRLLFKLNQTSAKQFTSAAGLVIDVLYDKKDYSQFVNRTSTYTTASSLGAAFQAGYGFNDNTIIISDRLAIPLVAFVDQPSYDNELPPGDTNQPGHSAGHYFKNGRFTSVSSLVRLKNSLMLSRIFNQRHTISLEYNWDFYRLRLNEDVKKQASHNVGITYQITL